MDLRLACIAIAGTAAAQAFAGGVAFTDVSAASGLSGFTHAPNFAAVPGLNEWTMGGFGIADFNGDGWPDIFVPRGGTGTDRLYINRGDGTFVNEAVARGVAVAHAGNGVSCADFDRDGDSDIYVTSYGQATDNLGQVGRHRLYRNDGAVFTEIAAAVGVNATSSSVSCGNGSAWGDYDLDGDLDLFVASWTQAAQGNRLFRNDGAAFTDVTGAAITVPNSWGFQPAFCDMDGDGYPELLLAADFETSQYWRNERDGTFMLRTVLSGTGIDDNGMGHCVADFDRDGRPDWYVTSVHMDVPNPGDWTGNALYLNQGAGTFAEASVARGCNDGGWGWGAVAADLDQDGWEEIVEVNGRNASEWASEQEYVFRNDGGSFVRLGAETGIALAADTRCVGTLDYDRDGDLDLVMLVNAGALKLFRNDGAAGRSVMLDLAAGPASRCAPHGLGAVVEAVVAGQVVRRHVHSGGGYQSSSEPVVHLGIGAAKQVDELRVLWPSGQTTRLTQVPAGSRLALAAPDAADLDADGAVGLTDLGLVLEAWGGSNSADRTMRRADVDGSGRVGAGDLAAVLARWTQGW
ncbi:MAG: CRTAC1 family protein [Planctomycetota bacterium]